VKPIKITLANRAAIIAALDAVNGKATTHTCRVDAIMGLAERSEKWAINLLGSQKAAVGAKVYYRSGSALPNAYKYSRRVTSVYIQRKSRDWWLYSLVADDARRDAGGSQLILTQAQDAIAKAKFSSQYRVSTI
jgi:hypothetical protein